MDKHIEQLKTLGETALVEPTLRSNSHDFEFERLGEAIAASLLQTADQQLREAENLYKQTEALAEGIRAQIAEQAKRLASMHTRLKSLGESVFDAHQRYNGS